MSYFRPQRASTPSKPIAGPSSHISDFTDDSHAPSTIAPELVGLSAEEIDFIDEVISRAPATASTFLTVFKAYNDVLAERGLDPQNEVVYYGKLLKIGTLKGKSWTEKWSMVKDQQGYALKASTSTRGGRTTRVTRTTPTPVRPTAVRARGPYTPDTFTLHSHQDDSEQTGHDTTTTTVLPARRQIPNTPAHRETPRPISRYRTPITHPSTNTLGLDTGPPSSDLTIDDVPRRTRSRGPAAPVWDAETAETTTQVSSVPPAYSGSGFVPAKGKGKGAAHRLPTAFLPSSPSLPPTQPTQPPQKHKYQYDVPVRQQRSNSVTSEDPFEKIRREQDEQVADGFRNDRLVEQCFQVWKQGYEWIITTGEQIADARDCLILRKVLQRWRQHAAARREYYSRVATVSDDRLVKRFFKIWFSQHKERKQLVWRDEMRKRMKRVKDRRERRVTKELWAKWRQVYLSRLSEQQFSRTILHRFFQRWHTKLRKLDELEAAADHFTHARDGKIMERYWDSWHRTTELHVAEKRMKERVGLRLLANAMAVWKSHLDRYQEAERFWDRAIVKHTFSRWKSAQTRIQALENRAVKHAARRDDVMVRAIVHIWRARERGKLMTRHQASRSLKQAWAKWKRRVEEHKDREELAQMFRSRSSSILAGTALKRWRTVLQSHQNAQSVAVERYQAILQDKMLFAWRVKLRVQLQKARDAKMTRKNLLVRRCFRTWSAKLAERKRQHKLRQLELQIVKKRFQVWRERLQEERAVKAIRQTVSMRLMHHALRHWTTRVADNKFRELEVIQHRDKQLMENAYSKWKALRKRRKDELELMKSYQDIKREEKFRKMFYRWLTAAKKTRHKRLQLQAREEEFKSTVIAGAWDKWRERYQDIRLQPLADAFIKQHESDLVLRAYALWHSKSRSLPAVKFHASHVKARYWKQWRSLMPRALQSKAAREVDSRNTLAKAFAHWKQVRKRRMDRRAISIARVIPVNPDTSPYGNWKSAQASRPRDPRPIRRTRPASPTEDENEDEDPPGMVSSASRPPLPISSASRARAPFSSASRTPFPRPSPTATTGLDIASVLRHRARTVSPERPKFPSKRTPREPSPSEPVPEPVPEPAPVPAPAPTTSYGGGGITAWRREVRPLPPKSAPPSVAGDVAPSTRGRSSLWQELSAVRRRSRAPTERTYSPEP